MRRVPGFAAVVVTLTIACLAVLSTTSSAQARTWDIPRARAVADIAVTPGSLDAFEDSLMVAINKARRANSVQRIAKFDACTDRMAEEWGHRIATTDAWEHRDQNQVIDRCRTTWAGEALIRGEGLTPASMVKAWLNSPPHRAILLSTKAEFAGVAVTQNARGELIGVLNVTRR